MAITSANCSNVALNAAQPECAIPYVLVCVMLLYIVGHLGLVVKIKTVVLSPGAQPATYHQERKLIRLWSKSKVLSIKKLK